MMSTNAQPESRRGVAGRGGCITAVPHPSWRVPGRRVSGRREAAERASATGHGPRGRCAAAGMTLVELMLGVAVLSILGVAMVSMWTAAAHAWDTRADYQQQTAEGRALSAKLAGWIRQARRIVALHEDGGQIDLVLWANDEQFPKEVNLSEIQLLRYDRGTERLTLYAAPLTPAQRGNAAANPAYEPTTVAQAGFPDRFIQEPRVTDYRLAADLRAVEAELANPGGGPPHRFAHLKITQRGTNGEGDRVLMVAGLLRAPDMDVAFQPDGGNDNGNGNNGNGNGNRGDRDEKDGDNDRDADEEDGDRDHDNGRRGNHGPPPGRGGQRRGHAWGLLNRIVGN